jgi:hypothetical protein
MTAHWFGLVRSNDKVDLISDVLPFGWLLYGEPNAMGNAISYAQFFSRSHNALIRVYDVAGNVIDTHEHAGDFNRVVSSLFSLHGATVAYLVSKKQTRYTSPEASLTFRPRTRGVAHYKGECYGRGGIRPP